MNDEQQEYIIGFLNDVAPDTFNEGRYASWEFTKVTRKGDIWTLTFEADGIPGKLTFPMKGECVDEEGLMSEVWFDQALVPAIAAWEDLAENPEVETDEDGGLTLQVSEAEIKRRLAE